MTRFLNKTPNAMIAKKDRKKYDGKELQFIYRINESVAIQKMSSGIGKFPKILTFVWMDLLMMFHSS